MSKKEKSPLWLPKGSIRAVLALSVVGASIYGFIVGLIGADVFAPLAVAVIAFYFKEREKSQNS